MVDTGGAPRAVWAFAEHEHRDLIHGIDHMHDVACAVGTWATPELTVHIREILSWVDAALQPHVSWEESWLYPEIDARTGTPWATRAARFDHAQIRTMAARLRTDQETLLAGGAHEHIADLRCHLFGLEALLRAHVEREERYLMPLLEEDIWVGGPAQTGIMTGAAAKASDRAG
jgi:hypothetical protein